MAPISQTAQGTRGLATTTLPPIGLLTEIAVAPFTIMTLPSYIQQTLPYWVPIINQNIQYLNQIISAYNAETNPQIKQFHFEQLIAQNQLIKDMLRGDIISSLPDLQNKLYKQLAPEIVEHAKQFQPTDPFISLMIAVPNFNDVLNGMSQEKLSRLMEILSHGPHTTDIELDGLYDVTDMSTEAQLFRSFRQSYTLTFLGGGNAQNFKLTRLDTNEESVLKVEYRMNSPKVVERRLRSASIQAHFPNIYAERQATFIHGKHGQTTCCLIQTDLAQGGDLEIYAKKFAGHPLHTLLAASDLFEQMSDVFISMQQQCAAFPDAKNTNWLVDRKGKLVLADTKSYIPIKPDGTFIQNENLVYYGFSCIRTPYVSPPEILTQDMSIPIDADAMHAYMLGKNLYQFVTDCGRHLLENKTNFDFTLPVFQTPEGMLTAQIIQNTILDNPQHRMKLSLVQSQLKTIQAMLSAKKEANALLTRLSTLDPQNKTYFENLRIRLNNSGNLAEVQINQHEVELQFDVISKTLSIRCETLKNQLTAELQKLAPEFKQEIEQWEIDIQQALSPESLHLISQQIAHQKDIIQEIKAGVRKAGYQTQPKETQEKIRALIKKTVGSILQERDLSKLESAKISIALKIQEHIQKQFIKPNTINSIISYKKELDKITDPTALKSAQKTTEDSKKTTFNPMHRS